jgi:hypothetical protein
MDPMDIRVDRHGAIQTGEPCKPTLIDKDEAPGARRADRPRDRRDPAFRPFNLQSPVGDQGRDQFTKKVRQWNLRLLNGLRWAQ